MSVETRRAERAPKTETEKLLQKEKTKAGLQAMAIGPVTGVLGLPSDILDLADMVNDAVAKYGEDTVLGQYSKLIKPSLDKVQEKYGREAFDRGFTELTGIKSDASNPPQMLGELISLGTLAKTGVKVAKTVGETFSDTYKGAKKLFEDSTMPPTSGPKLATVDDAPLPEIKETETLLQKPEKVDKTFQTPTTEDYGNLPIINPTIIGLQTEMGQKAIKQFENLEKTTNKTPEELFAETGVYRGPDKKLRYELDDRGAKLTNSIKKAFKNFDSDAKVEDLKSLNRVFRLEEVFDFPALYKQYDLGIKRDGVMYGPIKDLEIKFKKVLFNFNTLGGYDPVDDVIEINLNAQAFGSTSKKFPNIRIDKQTRQARIEATILHEIQHAIQQREGFFSGGNTKDRLAKINPNYEQDTKTNNAFLQKALDKLGENKKNRFPIESFIKEKIDLQDRASQGLEIGDFRKSLLESKKESLDNLDIPSKVKAAYAKSYEKYYKNKKVLDDQNRKAYNEYREIYGEREARLVEKRFLKRKKLLEKDTGLKRLFGGRRDKTDTSLREDTEFVKELGGVSPKAKVVRDADGEIIDVVSSKSEISSKDFKPETIRVGEFPASQKRWFLDGDTVTLYHGTSKENLENVATSGLKGDAEGLVYTSPDVHSATGYASVKGGEAANLKGKPKLNIGDENRITLKYEIPKNEFLKLVGDPDKTQRSLTSKKKLFGKDSKELYNKTKDESASNYYEATEIRFKEGDIDKYLVGAVERVRTPKSQNLNLNQADPDIATANSIIENPKLAEEWKSQNSVKQKQKQNPELQKAANDLLDGKITGKQFREKVKTVNPIVPIGKVPPIPSFTDIVGSLLKKQVEKGIYGLNKEIPDGTRVSSRLDIPAYERYDKWIVSIHDSFHKGRKDSIQGEAIAYGKTIVLNNVSFKSLPSRGLRIAAGAEKNTIGRIFGDIKNEAPESVASRAKRHLNEDEWSEIGFNPYRHGFFYNKATGLPVATADEVVQIGPLVLARNAKKMTISEMKQTGAEGLPVRAGKPIEGLKNLKRTKTLFKKGGTIMKEQMELFQEG